MARKYSMAHLGCLSWTPAEMIYCAKAIGYDYVSIRILPMGVEAEFDYDFTRHPELLRLTRQAMEETGVGIHDIELAKIHDHSDVPSFEASFEAAADLGAKAVISSIWTEDRERYLEQFAQVCDLAAQYGLRVGLEFVTWATIWNLKQAREVLELVNRPNAGLMIDTLHAHRSRVSLKELEECPKEWFDFAHVCGGPVEIPDRTDLENLIYYGRDDRFYLTDPENGVDAAGMIRRMREDTVLSLELPNTKHAREWGIFEHERRVLQTTKEYLKKAGLDEK